MHVLDNRVLCPPITSDLARHTCVLMPINPVVIKPLKSASRPRCIGQIYVRFSELTNFCFSSPMAKIGWLTKLDVHQACASQPLEICFQEIHWLIETTRIFFFTFPILNFQGEKYYNRNFRYCQIDIYFHKVPFTDIIFKAGPLINTIGSLSSKNRLYSSISQALVCEIQLHI